MWKTRDKLPLSHWRYSALIHFQFFFQFFFAEGDVIALLLCYVRGLICFILSHYMYSKHFHFCACFFVRVPDIIIHVVQALIHKPLVHSCLLPIALLFSDFVLFFGFRFVIGLFLYV